MPSDNGNNMKDHDILIKIRGDVSNIRDDVSDIKKAVRAQNGRVRRLEINKAYLWGGISVVAIVIPILFKYVL